MRSLYEPGSTQKAVTVSAALEEGIVDWDTQYLVEDQIEVVKGACDDGNEVEWGCFTDFSPHPPETLTVRDCVRLSSNVCTVKIGEDLGESHLVAYLDAFGYGARTGIDYPGEAKGTVNLPRGCSTCPASASIGYSLSVSPLLMASVYATIANDGIRMEPRMVTGIVDSEGMTEPPRRPSQRVLSASTSRLVRLMLKSVVDSGNGNQGGRTRLHGWREDGHHEEVRLHPGDLYRQLRGQLRRNGSRGGSRTRDSGRGRCAEGRCVDT